MIAHLFQREVAEPGEEVAEQDDLLLQARRGAAISASTGIVHQEGSSADASTPTPMPSARPPR